MPTEADQQRGLTLISALINFVDWLDREGLLKSLPETERAQLVLKFFDAHQPGENYFLQAEQVMEILGKPFIEDVTRCAHCGSTDIEDISGEYETGVVAPDGYRERRYENAFRCLKCGQDQEYEQGAK